MPNPKWILIEDEADSFVKQLAALPPSSARQLSGNLGYRGFVITCAQGADTRVIYVQNGTVRISIGETNVYANDKDRQLERWLLNTARPYLSHELFQMVEREF